MESGMPSVCMKCKNDLTYEEKKLGLPLCQDCIGSLTDILMRKIRKSDEKKVEQEIDNFTRFILSSGKLFKLDGITVIQCCFNIFIRETAELKDTNLIASQKILRDAIKFMERELENINVNFSDKHTSSVSNNSLSKIDELLQMGMKNGNGDNIEDKIEDIKRCIDKGREKGKHKEENIKDIKDGTNKDDIKDDKEDKKNDKN